MHDTELQRYCERHNLEVVEQYSTLGGDYREFGGSHYRAIVKDRATGEQQYLYYDKSRKRGTFKARGWRNTTLDNRRKKVRQAHPRVNM